jgi:hypothetical protein
MNQFPKIGVFYIVTGRYKVFWPEFLESFKTKFLPEAERHIYLFTDEEEEFFRNNLPADISLSYHRIEHQPWPFMTLMRYHLFMKHYEEWKDCDYIFFINSTYIFYKKVGTEILPGAEHEYLVAAEHRQSVRRKPDCYTYDRNPASKAYIPYGQGSHYYAGGFNGGTVPAFKALCESIIQATDEDLSNDIIALWHDESHLNAYLLNRHIKVLPPTYVWLQQDYKWYNKHKIIAGTRQKIYYGGEDWLRGKSDIKEPSPAASRPPVLLLILILLCAAACAWYLLAYISS